MEYGRLGRSGLQVSVIGLGCNNFGGRMDEQATRAVVDASLDQGITLFDTADMYGGGGLSEEYLGKALQGRRQDVLIATKFAWPMADGSLHRGASRRYIFEAVEASLRRLGTDFIDLYQVHLPDAETPLEETMRALDDLVRQGKVRYLGCSNFAGWQLVDAQWVARAARTATASSPLRTSTTCSTGTSSAISSPRATLTGWGSCPTSRSPAAFSQASTAAGRMHLPAPGSPPGGIWRMAT